jgi:hypothetical protein
MMRYNHSPAHISLPTHRTQTGTAPAPLAMAQPIDCVQESAQNRLQKKLVVFFTYAIISAHTHRDLVKSSLLTNFTN